MTSAASLTAELELSLSATGDPANPLVIIRLDRWRDAPSQEIAAAARLVAGALPVTAGILEGPPDPALAPLIEAATLTLATSPSERFGDQSTPGFADEPSPANEGGHARWPLERAVVGWAADVGLGLEEAVAGLRDAVAHSPRAAVACGQLVRQTAAIVPRRIGRWRAAWLMLTGTRLPAPVALRWGLEDSISDQ